MPNDLLLAEKEVHYRMSQQYDRLIIDGNNFLFRAFFIKRPSRFVLGNLDVTPIQNFMSMLRNCVYRFKPKEVVFTWDKRLNHEHKNFRKDLIAYKEQRVETEQKIQLIEAIDHIQKFLDALGIKTIYPYCMEADDVVRYLATNVKGHTLIVSSDKDLLQLVSDDVSVFLPNKDLIVDPSNFETIVSVKREQFLLYKSIMGDTSDNVIGLDKFGPVRAKALAEKLFTEGTMNLDSDIINDDQRAIIVRNLKVVDLAVTESVCPEEYESYRTQDAQSDVRYDGEKLKELFKEYEMTMFIRSIGDWNSLFNHNSPADVNLDDLLSFISM